MIDALEKLLAEGRDSPTLRFGLGQAYLARGDGAAARTHLEQCVVQQPEYSAAWKLLGKAYQLLGDAEAAERAWTQGIETALRSGDKQAEKEMIVFLKRLRRAD